MRVVRTNETVTVAPPAQPPQPQAPEIKRERSDYERVGKSALWILFLLSVAGAAITVNITLFVFYPAAGWLMLWFSFAAIVAATIGVRWQWQTIQSAREIEEFLVYGPTDPVVVEQIGDTRLIGLDILTRHYVLGLPATREACMAAGIQQDDWNRAAAVMKAIGLRHGYKFADLEPAEALERWGDLVWRNGAPYRRTKNGMEIIKV